MLPLIPRDRAGEKVTDFKKNYPIDRAPQPSELAAVYVSLASAAASYLSGTTYAMTGRKPPT